METKHDILVQNKREVQFKLTIKRKFTVIRGDSATGKTTLFQMISDGCAIGAYIQDIELTGASLYLPESFEWMLLNNGMFQNDDRVSELLEYPEKVVDTSQISIEKYSTYLLNEITKNTPAQYTKSQLNKCYVEQCCCKGTKCEFFTRNKVIELNDYREN